MGAFYSCGCEKSNSRNSGCRYVGVGHSGKTYAVPKEGKQALGLLNPILTNHISPVQSFLLMSEENLVSPDLQEVKKNFW